MDATISIQNRLFMFRVKVLYLLNEITPDTHFNASGLFHRSHILLPK